jgi:hypothetical protein
LTLAAKAPGLNVLQRLLARADRLLPPLGLACKTVAELPEVEVMCLNNAEDRALRVDLTRSMSAVMNYKDSV